MLRQLQSLFCSALTALAVSASASIPDFQPSKKYIPNIGSGNVTSISNPVSRIAYSYDPMNRLANSTLTVSTISTSLTVSSSYDLNGNRTNIVYPGGLNVGYSYDAENRLSGVTTKYTNSTKTFAFGYDGASRLTNLVYPNGVQAALAYDAESRVLEYRHSKGASNLLRHVITRDPRGFKTVEDIYAGLVPNFTNGLHQTRTHNDADQLLSAGTNAYSYDANGCLTNHQSSITNQQFVWDYDNRLIQVSNFTSQVSYLYDASGARVGRIAGVSPAVTNYFAVDYVDPLKRPLAEFNADGSIKRFYVWAPSTGSGQAGFRLLAQIETNGTTRYYHSDELGSTLALSDSAGNVTDQFAYAPYGELLSRTGTNNTPFLWLGGYGVYYDSAVNLHLTLHRAYSAEQKRFISTDPMGIDGGVNLYAYGNLNPVNFVDPLGLYWFRQPWQEPGVVGRRDHPWIPPGGRISEFIERHVSAGYTFGQMHDAFVGAATSAGWPDWLVNIPSMPYVYELAEIVELLRTLGILEQPSPPEEATPCK